MNKIVMKVRQLLCRHDYQWYRRVDKSSFVSLRGEIRVLVCEKCGKVDRKSEFVAEYEGQGFK